MSVHICVYTHLTTINKKEAMNLKESKEGHMEGLGEKKRREHDIIISRTKSKIKRKK